MRSKVYLIGAGPGDPGLITVRGRDVVNRADVIVVDDLVNPLLLLSNPTAQIIYVGKRGPGAPQGSFLKLPQKKINSLLVQLAKKYKTVARLKGGDPLIFARGGEEMEALRKAGVSYEIIPGVTSAVAGPAYAGIPLSDRRWASTITFLTGQESASSSSGVDWEKLPVGGTLVILMGVARWPSIKKNLLNSGWSSSTPVAAVQSATCQNQQVYLTKLGESDKTFKSKKLVSPAIVVVGDVSNLSQRLSWVEKEKPLLGKKVVVTRAAHQSRELISSLEEKGAFVIPCPAISIEPLHGNESTAAVVEALRNKTRAYDWIAFMSENGVQSFRSLIGAGREWLGLAKIFSVGSHTQQSIERAGWPVHRVAHVFNSPGALRSLGNVKGKRFLVPRVQEGPMDFVSGLRRRGAMVDEISTYRTVSGPLPSSRLKGVLLSGVDFITFTSGSTVDYFFKFFSSLESRRIFSKATALSIGPVTSTALRRKGIRKIKQASTATTEGMIDAIL